MQGMKNPGRDARVLSFSSILFSPYPRATAPTQREPIVRLQDRRTASALWTRDGGDGGDGGHHPLLLRDQGAEAFLPELVCVAVILSFDAAFVRAASSKIMSELLPFR